ncbi:hypothetical protein BH11PSE10_BH11PSE10_04350 [soil metagenome]
MRCCFTGLLLPLPLPLLLSAALLAGCAQTPQRLAVVDDRAALAEIAPDEAGQRYQIDSAESSLRIHVFRAGRAVNLGHNHVLTVPSLSGLLLLPVAGKAEGARFALSFRLDALALDAPDLRAALGPAWASLMSPEAIAATRVNMLGEGNLQADRFPEVHIRSRQFGGEWPKLVAEVEIELHGQRRRQWLPLQAELSAGHLKASGALVLRQSDFGIAPFSVLGGLLAVRDELLIEFDLLARPRL